MRQAVRARLTRELSQHCSALPPGVGWSGVALGDTCQSHRLINCNAVQGKSSGIRCIVETKYQTPQCGTKQAVHSVQSIRCTRPECRSSACKSHMETSQTDGGSGGQHQVRSQHEFTSMIGMESCSRTNFGVHIYLKASIADKFPLSFQ